MSRENLSGTRWELSPKGRKMGGVSTELAPRGYATVGEARRKWKPIDHHRAQRLCELVEGGLDPVLAWAQVATDPVLGYHGYRGKTLGPVRAARSLRVFTQRNRHEALDFGQDQAAMRLAMAASHAAGVVVSGLDTPIARERLEAAKTVLRVVGLLANGPTMQTTTAVQVNVGQHADVQRRAEQLLERGDG